MSRGKSPHPSRRWQRFAHSWPTISRHLRLLQEAGLVRTESEGRERYYVINEERLFGVGRRWFDYLGTK